MTTTTTTTTIPTEENIKTLCDELHNLRRSEACAAKNWDYATSEVCSACVKLDEAEKNYKEKREQQEKMLAIWKEYRRKVDVFEAIKKQSEEDLKAEQRRCARENERC
jgi:hypothetical protein